MKVGVISNSDLCLPLLFTLFNNKIETNLYFGLSSTIDPKREDVPRFCDNYNIAYSDQNRKSESVYEWMNECDPELVFVIGHLRRIDLGRVNARSGIFNIHFGKLPQYRGASPLFWQLKKMEPTLGICIHGLTEEIDSGPIYWQKEIRNEEHFSHNYVQYLFSNLLLEGINEIFQHLNNSSLQSIEQDDSKACWYPRPSLKEVLINWEKMSANEICCLVRACNNWNAGAITLYQGMEMKIIDASYEPGEEGSHKAPGIITSLADSIKVRCIEGNEISIHYLSLNSIPFPGRQAKHFGIAAGERFTYPID